ncbi:MULTISPECIES: CARDB domain-containing protein [Rhodomicrobium]|uniref:CARDB domain-containing protein n=1 Tax=Rhodomicrobium TaxID=1068 RepID=UPI000F73FA3D|nr:MULTISPECIES: CARDB domain-containing protein [Rhodomicrobium]
MSVARRGVAIALAGIIAVLGADLVAAQGKKKHEEETSKETSKTPAPDLVIVDSETVIKAGGCDVGDPLITGTIAIKNRGDARADRLLAKPISAVYIPETLDVKDEDIVPNALQPLELFSTDILAGKGVVKTGRGFEGQRKVYVVVDPYNEIPESNEKNNLIVRTVTFKCK